MSENKGDVAYVRTKTTTKSKNQDTETVTETEIKGIHFSIFAKIVAAGGVTYIGVYYYSLSPELATVVFNSLCRGLGLVAKEIAKLAHGSLVVEVLCSSKKRFVKVVDAYLSGNLKTNLSYELSKIGFTDVTVEIKNIEEVIKLREKFRREMCEKEERMEEGSDPQKDGEAKIEYEQTVTKNTTGWTSWQRQRLAVEKSILDKYFPGCVTWISPRRNAKIDVFVKCNSGTQHTLRVYIPNDFPNSCPNMVIKEPESRIPDFPDLRSSRIFQRNHEGYLLICHSNVSKWNTETTLFEVFVKGQLWLEAYEDHLPRREIVDAIFDKHSLCTIKNYKTAA